MKLPDIDALFSSVKVTPFVGRAVIHCRGVRKMTQKQLAEAAGVDESAIKKMEAGRKTGGWVRTLEAVCRALRITLKHLFEVAERLAFLDAVKTLFLSQRKVAS